jgi:hypothetical protein
VVKIGYFINKFTENNLKMRYVEMFMNMVFYACHQRFAALQSGGLRALNYQATTKIKNLHLTTYYAKPLL